MVLILDLCALIIHIDLYMITKYKKRLFTPILEWKLISQKQLSPYATAYRNSLTRNWFCILDTVSVNDVPGIKNISQLLMVTNSVSILWNILDMCGVLLFGFIVPTNHLPKTNRGINYSSLMFFTQAPFYYICLMYALVGYNSKQELCFHCKYGLFVIETLSILLITFFLLSSFPWVSLICAFAIFACVVTVRQAGIDERKQKHEFKMARLEKEKNKKALEKEKKKVQMAEEEAEKAENKRLEYERLELIEKDCHSYVEEL
jgi:hypothetical protein